MGFLDSARSKISEVKQNVTNRNDRKKVSDLVDQLASFPLCSEVDASLIVESLITKYLGQSRHSVLMRVDSSPEGLTAAAEFLLIEEKERNFLNILLEDEFEHSLKVLRGSICVNFIITILTFLGDTEEIIDETLYEEFLTVMLREASGYDIYLYFVSGSSVDIYESHIDYKNKNFSEISFPGLEQTAQSKYQSYIKTSQAQENDISLIATTLETDAIGFGRTMDLYNYEDLSWSEGTIGRASVTRMIEYYMSPRMLQKQIVSSIYNLSNEMKQASDVHWHFCEDGILQIHLDEEMKPTWISKENIQKLTFGEGYDGLSNNGLKDYEYFYLYMTVQTVKGDEFTLFRFLSGDQKNAKRNFSVYLNSTFPKLANYYPVNNSGDIYDVSKHYTTTYTTTYVWGVY